MTEVFLNPGEWFVGDQNHTVRTLLGSCVSITLWHPTLRVGAMSHFLLATRGHSAPAPDGRYADEVLPLMIDALAERKAYCNDLQAKLFGGSDMFPGQRKHNGVGIGRTNGDAARRLLSEAGIALCSESLFGTGHRRIVFDLACGHVWSCQVLAAQGGTP